MAVFKFHMRHFDILLGFYLLVEFSAACTEYFGILAKLFVNFFRSTAEFGIVKVFSETLLQYGSPVGIIPPSRTLRAAAAVFDP